MGPQGGALLWASIGLVANLCSNPTTGSPELSPSLFPLALPK